MKGEVLGIGYWGLGIEYEVIKIILKKKDVYKRIE